MQDRKVVGDGRGSWRARVDGRTRAGEAIEALVVEAEAATIEVQRARADIGCTQRTDRDRARIDRQVATEGVVADEAEVTGTRLGETARAGDITRDGQITTAHIDGASARDSDRATTEVEGLGADEVEVTRDRQVRRVGEGHASRAGRVERRASTEGDRARTSRERVIEVHHAWAEDQTTGERIGGAQREVTRTDLGDRAGTHHGFVHHDVTRAAQVERAVDIVVIVDRTDKSKHLTSVDRIVGEGTARDGIDREVLSRGVTVTGDGDLTAT